jgi:hypothetical protein
MIPKRIVFTPSPFCRRFRSQSGPRAFQSAAATRLMTLVAQARKRWRRAEWFLKVISGKVGRRTPCAPFLGQGHARRASSNALPNPSIRKLNLRITPKRAARELMPGEAPVPALVEVMPRPGGNWVTGPSARGPQTVAPFVRTGTSNCSPAQVFRWRALLRARADHVARPTEPIFPSSWWPRSRGPGRRAGDSRRSGSCNGRSS